MAALRAFDLAGQNLLANSTNHVRITGTVFRHLDALRNQLIVRVKAIQGSADRGPESRVDFDIGILTD